MGKRKWSLARLYDLMGRPMHTDYRLKRDYVQLEVENLSVKISKGNEGITVDIWPIGDEMGEPIASTYAFYNEGEIDL